MYEIVRNTKNVFEYKNIYIRFKELQVVTINNLIDVSSSFELF